MIYLDDDINDALSGLSTNDEGIDAFFIDKNNQEINIIQCKSCKSTRDKKALKKDWLSFLNAIPQKLENHDFIDNHKNPRIKEIAEEYIKYKYKNFKVHLHFFHLGHADKNALMHYEDMISYHDWGAIKDEFQEYKSKLDRTEPTSIEVQLTESFIQPNLSNQHKTLVSVMTGDEIIRLRETYRYKLFDKNLRFGLGKNKINKGIMKTAEVEPELFYFYNNGITITSKRFKCKETNNKLTIEYPQIINGAQTVNAIYEAFEDKKNKIARRDPSRNPDEEAKKHFKRLRLLFRVIQDDEKDGKKNSQFEENVTRYNNSQTIIKETDFYANNPEQIKLQELFAKFGYFYEIKRGDRNYLNASGQHNLLNKKKDDFTHWDEKIDMEKLASRWMAYYQDPCLDKVKRTNIFGHEKYYRVIFEDADKIEDEQVKEMILAWNLFDCISQQADIYGNKKLTGQIVTKITQINSNDKNFKNIKEIITGSFLFGSMIKKNVESWGNFSKEKENILEQVKKYQFFSLGKYMALAIFNLILKKCAYEDYLIKDTDNYQDKEFINQYLVKAWLKTIMDEIVIKEYETFVRDIGGGLKAFYDRNNTWESIKQTFDKLHYTKDQEFKKIFPLDCSSKKS